MRIFEQQPASRRLRIIVCTLTCLLFFSFQQISYAQVNRPLDKRISFKVSNMSLTEVLRKFREVSGVHITFNQEDIRKEQGITVDLSKKTGREVLDKILSQTNLVYVEATDGNILLVPRKSKKENTRVGKYFDVNGQVVDQNGNPLPHASIMVMPEKKGLSTDTKGMFNFVANENDVLVFSYLGMKSTEVTVKKDGFMKVVLDTAPVVMTEYVVTGYQKIDKRMVTGSVTVLKSEDFLRPGAASVSQMLQGKVPGMSTIMSSGSPSATPKIRIRGTSTILGNASPLWVVDDIIREDNVNMNPLQLNAVLSDAANSNFAIVGNAIAGVNPNDIESITVLKDAAATSIYGVRAANGVIVVKTKRGKAGPTRFSYSSSLGVTARPRYDQLYLMNSQERVNFSREMINDQIYYDSRPIPVSYEGLIEKLNSKKITQEEFAAEVKKLELGNTDWLKLLGRNAINHSHNISLSGGTGKAAYYFSAGYSANKGAMKGDDLEMYTTRASLDLIPSSTFRLSLGLDAAYRKADGFFRLNPLDYALKTTRAISPTEFYTKSIKSAMVGNILRSQEYYYNIFNEIAGSGTDNKSTSANLNVSWNYRPIKGLTLSGTYGFGTSSSTSFSFQTDRTYAIALHRGFNYGEFEYGSPEFNVSDFPYGGLAYPSNSNQLSYTLRHQASYDLLLFGGRDQFNINIAQEIRSTRTDGQSSQEPGYYPDRGNTYHTGFLPKFEGLQHTVMSTNTLDNYVSWLGIISYRLLGKYTFYGNIRSDGSNRFGQYSNQAFLPNWSLSARWDVHSENWLKQLKWLTQFSVRGSYGSQGNVVTQVGPNLIASYPSSPRIPFDLRSGEAVLDLKSLPYPELRWEKSKSLNIGVDASFFEGRLNLVWNYWNRKTTDLLITRNVGQEYGIAQMYMNYGTMENSGWDGTVMVTPVRSKDFEWSQTFNYGYTKNKLGASDSKFTEADYINGTAILPGMPLGSFYSYPFIGLGAADGIPRYDFNTDKPGFNADDPATWLVYSGPKEPTVEVGSTTSMRYKRFSLTASFVVKLGNKRRLNQLYTTIGSNYGMPGPEANLSREYLNRWRKPGDELFTNIPAFKNKPASGWPVKHPTASGGSNFHNPYYLYDLSTARLVNGDFLRCTFVSLAYVVPDKALLKYGIKNMSISANVSNPFLIANKAFRGQDPEADNIGAYSLPITPNYTLGLNLNF